MQPLAHEFLPAEMQHVTAGKIIVLTRFDTCTIRLERLQYTPNTALLDLSGYMGGGKYYYDDVTGVIIDNSMLFLRAGIAENVVFTVTV